MSEKDYVNPRDILHIPESIELHVRVLKSALNRLKAQDQVKFLKEVIGSLDEESRKDLYKFMEWGCSQDSWWMRE